MATGGDTHPKVPAISEQIDPGIRQLHASEYHDPDSLLPGPVLVVGLGQALAWGARPSSGSAAGPGYRQDFSFIHPSPVGEDGWPRDRAGVMEDLPGLYFMGLLFHRGFYSMLVGGAGRDAQRISGAILRRTRVSSPSAG